MNTELSPMMQELVAFMRENAGMVIRHPGGFWGRSGLSGYVGKTYGTSSVHALVTRGVAEYSEWQDGRRGRFPVAAKLKQQPVDRQSEQESAVHRTNHHVSRNPCE